MLPSVPRPPLSLALIGLSQPSALREQIEWAASLKAEAGDESRRLRAVQLNAAAPGCRPRELTRSARRDLAALLRRNELCCSGVDLFVPPEHLTDPSKSDRALSALLESLDFAADLAELTGGRPTVSTMLLPLTTPGMQAVRDALCDRAAGRSVRIADHRWPQWLHADRAEHGISEPADSPMGVGIDPAVMFLAEGPLADPGREVSRLGLRVVSARLSDASSAERVEPGGAGGRLDILAYEIALTTAGYSGHLVIDLRGIRNQGPAAVRAISLAG